MGAAYVDTVVDQGTGQHSGPVPGPAAEHRRPGRPRSERADRAIIDAALSLFAEHGVEGLCIEKVAARAGVGKATIYRRWPGKEDLLLDALAALKTPLPEPRGESVREDLIALLEAMSADVADPRRAREFALLLGEGTKFPRLMTKYTETVVEPRRDVIRSVLRRGVAAGELRAETDIDVALFMLTGAVLARGKYQPEAISAGYAERVVDELLLGLARR
ncbi:MAG TPA: TetR/AcrR family transcriptional regulator [Streptosporangiaceae bacterium]|nr:TetR/AcrR family transcriptional regulator [Streptosporangiaceae bacterium]